MAPTIHDFYDLETGTFSYLVRVGGSGDAAVIDPVLGFDPASGCTDTGLADRLLEAAAGLDCRIRWILETHAHADHLSAGDYLRGRTGAELAIGAGIAGVRERFRCLFDAPPVEEIFDRLLHEDDELPLGGESIRALRTPGHTGDSMTYLIGDAAFVGDTVFPPPAGTARCDFPGGDARALFASLKRLHALPPQTRLYFCHDYPDSGREPRCSARVTESWANNIHLGPTVTEARFVAMRRKRDAGLGAPRLLYPSLQVNLRGGRLPEAEQGRPAFLKLPLDFDLANLGRDEGDSTPG